MRQLDWLALFEQNERNRAARKKFVDELDIDPRAKQLILAVDALAERKRSPVLPDGSREITIPAAILLWELERSKNTLKPWLDLCPPEYLEVDRTPGRTHTYRIRWQAIVDRLPAGDGSVGRTANETGLRDRLGGSLGGSLGGLGRLGRLNSPNSPPPKPSPRVSNPRAFNEISKNPRVFKPSPNPSSTVPIAVIEDRGRRRIPGETWQRWREAAMTSNLSDPAIVEALFRLAVDWGMTRDSEQDRIEFFAAAIHDLRMSDRRGKPGSVFASNVGASDYKTTTCAEIDEARAILKKLDFPDSLGSEAETCVTQDEAPRPAQTPEQLARMKDFEQKLEARRLTRQAQEGSSPLPATADRTE